jgi:hypothetical protein
VEELWEWLPEELLLRVLEILRRDSGAVRGVGCRGLTTTLAARHCGFVMV